MSYIFVGFALFLSALFSVDIILPIWATMALSCLVVVLLFLKTGIFDSLLSKFFIFLYVLPFIHGFEYLGFDFEETQRPALMWGLLTNAYTFSESIISRMLMLALVGLLGITAFPIRNQYKAARTENPLETYKSLNLPRFITLLCFAFTLSWLNTPSQSIFTHSYGSGGDIVSTFNFNASWLLAYVVIVGLFVDQEFLFSSKSLRRSKRILLLGVTAYIVIFHQFLRGDRECITLILSLMLLLVVKWSDHFREKLAKSKKAYFIPVAFIGGAIAIVLIGNLVGSVRSILSMGNSAPDIGYAIQTSLSRFYAGTWSGVLLSPLSVVGDFFLGLMDLKWGSTYIDMLLSLIPSPLARLFDYARPLDSSVGPAWEMRFGIGGTHVLVVPYMNFGVFGVLGVMTLQGAFFAWLDRSIQKDINFSKIFLFGSFIVIGPHWYWYGDMSLIRGLMAYAISWCFYCVLASKPVLSEPSGALANAHIN